LRSSAGGARPPADHPERATWTSLGAPNDVTALNGLAVAHNGSIVVVGDNVLGGTVLAEVTP
jgi:hypothetical protein